MDEAGVDAAPKGPFSQLVSGSMSPVAAIVANPSVQAKQRAIDVLQVRPALTAPDQVATQMPVLPAVDAGAAEAFLPVEDEEAEFEDASVEDLSLIAMMPPVVVYAEEDKPVEDMGDASQVSVEEILVGDDSVSDGEMHNAFQEIEPQGLARREAALPLKLLFEAPVFPGVDVPVSPQGTSLPSELTLTVDTSPEAKAPIDLADDAALALPVVNEQNILITQGNVNQANRIDAVKRSLSGVVQNHTVHAEAALANAVPLESHQAMKADIERVESELPHAHETTGQLAAMSQPLVVPKPNKSGGSGEKPLASLMSSLSAEKSRQLIYDDADVPMKDDLVLEAIDEASDELEAMVERIVSQRIAPMAVPAAEMINHETPASDVKRADTDALSPITLTMSSVANKEMAEAQKANATVHQSYVPEHRHVTEQVHVSIRKAVDTGNDRLVLQLDPAHLGKVEVRMEMNAGSASQILFIAENKNTLEALQQDARYLEKALQDSGIKADVGTMEFSLKQNQTHQNGSGMENAMGNPREEILPPVETAEEDVEEGNTVTTHYMVQVTDGIDIKV